MFEKVIEKLNNNITGNVKLIKEVEIERKDEASTWMFNGIANEDKAMYFVVWADFVGENVKCVYGFHMQEKQYDFVDEM